MTAASLVLSGTLALLVAIQAPTADLSSARALYASASYDEALTVLASLRDPERVEEIHALRALCQLALGRNDAARQSIEALVLHNPLYQLPQTEVSPKLVSLFEEVRRETLPAAARALYAKGKSSYDDKDWAAAETRFKDVLTLIETHGRDAAADESSLGDLKQLADGFLSLAREENAAAARKAADAAAEAEAAERARVAAAAAAANDAASQAAASPAPPATPKAPEIYSVNDRDVTPPVEVRRIMPRWIPPTPAMGLIQHSGLLEVIIDETGAVASATLLKSVTPTYDQQLKDSTRTWRYRPATKAGQPVRYRQVLEIVLRPAQ